MDTSPALAVYGATLLAAALLSARARRTALSVSVLFVAAGIAAHTTGWLSLQSADSTVRTLATLTLFIVLFADGMRVSARDLANSWVLPARALGIAMPLTIGIIAVLGHALADLSWAHAALLASVLAPTDPVFASAIVRRDHVSQPLRRLLNVESGLNDALALPFVLAIVAWLGPRHATLAGLLAQIGGGAVLGTAIPWASNKLRSLVAARLTDIYTSLFAVAVGIVVFAAARGTGANEYIAAFAAGVSFTTCAPEAARQFHSFGEHASELLKFATLLAFGAMVSLAELVELGAGAWLLGALALLVARPLAVVLALLRTSLPWRERVAAAWFGPKGFASVVYSIIVLQSGIDGAGRLFHLAALTIFASIIAHSSTDVPVAQWLARQPAK